MRALLLFAVLGASPAAAQVTVSASVPSTRIALGEQLVLSVTISGSATAAPKIAPIPDVEVYESGRSSSMMIRNGSVTSSVVYAYVLAPRKPGKFRIPPVEVAGAAPTEAIDIEVGGPAATANPPSAPQAEPAPAPQRPPGSPEAYVTAELSKKKAFVNEQVTLTVRFFTAVPLLGPPQYQSPALSGLLAEESGGEGHGTVAVNGRPYNYSEIRTALFPVQPGRATVGPATVVVQVPRRGAPGSGDDFFDRFFNMQAPEVRNLTSDPLSIQIEPLPAGKPEDFSGVVGKLSVEATVDRTKVKAGEAVNLVVKVSGSGNIKSLPEPKRPDIPSARFFDSESSVTTNPPGGRAGGTKTFRTVLVPRVSGPLEIPSLSLSYFDPESKSYVRAKSKPITISVAAGDPNAALPIVGPGAQAPSAPGVTAVSEDVRYLRAPGGRSVLGDALAGFGAAGPLHALPVAFFVIVLALDWRRRLLASDPAARRAREARACAERKLADAEAATDRAKAVSLLAEALTGFLADKLRLPAAGLAYKSVAGRLPNPERVKAVWDELDLLRFAPNAADAAETARLAGELRALLDALDQELK